MLPSRRRAPEARPGAGSARAGQKGEELTASLLAAQGFRIEGRNVRTTFGEIDLLVRRRRLWIAVEVKTRHHHPAPERTVTPTQLARVRRALLALAPHLRPTPRTLREDVAAVTLRPDRTPEIRLFRGTSRPWPR
ncbi:MAG: YraN family protein [Planctomycetota bacterium]|jgi:putative endonuclease